MSDESNDIGSDEQPQEHVWTYPPAPEVPPEPDVTTELPPRGTEVPPAPEWTFPSSPPTAQHRARTPWRAMLTVALIAGLLGGAIGAFAVPRKNGVTIERVSATGSVVKQDLLTGVASVAQSVMPSIVRVDVNGTSGPFGQTD